MKINGNKVLITGGAGAIGSNLVNHLINLKCKVVIIDNLSSGFKFNLNKKSLFIKGSITENIKLKRAFEIEPEIVFHLTANFANQNSVDNPKKDLATNGMGTLKLLEFSIKNDVKRFIYASSSCVYKYMNTRETSTNFSYNTPYAITKLLGERYVNYFNDMYGLKTTILRYFNSYGPGEVPGRYRNVIPNFIFLAMQKKPLPITGTGNETRDFTYVTDVIKATIMATENNKAVGETFNVGTGMETKIVDIANKINKITRNQAGIKFIERRRWDYTIKRKANIKKMKMMLGYNPKVNLDKGLIKTYGWFKKHIDLIKKYSSF